jgi:hypothetical protein
VADGFNVDVEQLRAHMRNVDAVHARFAAVKEASAHIAQDDQAYGLLCGWISGILEDKHAKQDEVIAYVEENLKIVSEQLGFTADFYANHDESSAGLMRNAGGGLK